MKVGTDTMLLGALAEAGKKRKALDIGTGTGVLSLMLAQRFPEIQIDALEIDEAACEEARQNVRNSCFSTQIEVFQGDFTLFEFPGRYDLVISNPPYFEKASLSAHEQKNRARHTQSLGLNLLFEKTSRLLTDSGEFQLILPFGKREQILELAAKNNLFPRKIITLNGKEKQPVRCIFYFSHKREKLREEEFTIRNADGSYTDSYKSLTADYHFKTL